ncbi:MAG: aryl-sulfate sulfotransferase [Myxococcales bacterium]
MTAGFDPRLHQPLHLPSLWAVGLSLALAACPAPQPAGGDASGPQPGLDAGSAALDASAPEPSDAGGPDAGPRDASTSDAGASRPDATVTPPPTACPYSGPDRTVGLIECTEGAYQGYTLFAPIWSSRTYLVDMLGRVVHTWQAAYLPGMNLQLLENGDLLRSAHKSMFGGLPTGGGLQRFSWDGELVWDFEWYGDTFAAHHDFAVLPNGNVLLLYWETKTEIDVLALGYEPNGPVWPDALVEIRPTGPTTGEVVWEWHVWDYILPAGTPVAEHPELPRAVIHAHRLAALQLGLLQPGAGPDSAREPEPERGLGHRPRHDHR